MDSLIHRNNELNAEIEGYKSRLKTQVHISALLHHTAWCIIRVTMVALCLAEYAGLTLFV